MCLCYTSMVNKGLNSRMKNIVRRTNKIQKLARLGEHQSSNWYYRTGQIFKNKGKPCYPKEICKVQPSPLKKRRKKGGRYILPEQEKTNNQCGQKKKKKSLPSGVSGKKKKKKGPFREKSNRHTVHTDHLRRLRPEISK